MIEGLKPYANYRDSGVSWLGRIPEEWRPLRLKTLLTRNESGVWGEVASDGVVVLRSTEQRIDGGWNLKQPARVKLTERQATEARLQTGDLVVTKSSGSAAHIGKTSIVDEGVASLECCYSNFMQRLRVSSEIDAHLVWWFLNCPIGRGQLVFRTTTTTGLGNLNGKIIGDCFLGLPSLKEQRAIVRFLGYADRHIRKYIAAKRKLIELLEEQKRAIIVRTITRGLNPNVRLKPSGVEWLGHVPEHWEVARASTVCSFHSAKAHERFVEPDGEHVCVTARFVSTDGRSFRRCTENFSPARNGDVLMVMSDLPRGRALARAYLVNDDRSYAVNQRVCILRPTRVHPQFLALVANRHPELLAHDDGFNQTHLPNAAFKIMRLPLPPLDEQAQIAAFLMHQGAAHTAAVLRTEREIDLLREFRTRLISDVVTGKLDVRDVAAHLRNERVEELGTENPLDDAEADGGDAFDQEEPAA